MYTLIKQRNERIAIFVDLDGTLAWWIPSTTPEDLIAPGYFRMLPAYSEMVENVRYLISVGYSVFALSACMPTLGDPVDEKNRWLDQYLPEIGKDYRLFCRCDQSKWQVAHTAAGDNKTLILLDDYSKNLHAWVEDSDGKGIGIKIMNGINGTQGTWQGAKISNTCSPKELQEIIENFVI